MSSWKERSVKVVGYMSGASAAKRLFTFALGDRRPLAGAIDMAIKAGKIGADKDAYVLKHTEEEKEAFCRTYTTCRAVCWLSSAAFVVTIGIFIATAPSALGLENPLKFMFIAMSAIGGTSLSLAYWFRNALFAFVAKEGFHGRSATYLDFKNATNKSMVSVFLPTAIKEK